MNEDITLNANEVEAPLKKIISYIERENEYFTILDKSSVRFFTLKLKNELKSTILLQFK